MSDYTKTYTLDFTSTGDTVYTAVDKTDDNIDALIVIINKLKESYSSATAPSVPAPDDGQVWYNSTTKQLNYYNGSSWLTGGHSVINTTSVATSGTGEDNLMTATIAAGSMGSTGGLKVIVAGTKAGGNDDSTVIFYFGTVALTINTAATDTNDWRGEFLIVNTAAAAQRITWYGMNGATVVSGYDTGTENTAAAVTIKCTGECVSADDTITQTLLYYERVL
jgi:hypothetical protein